MPHFNIRSLIVIIALLAIAEAAYGQFCVTSDSGDNTACGTGTLSALTTGASNSAFGFSALENNSTGIFNTASGANALQFNISGNYNTAVGLEALNANTTGSNNDAVGYQALFSNTTANDNNAVGVAALYSNTTGSLNGALGGYSLYSNTTGSYNNSIGYAAMYNNTTGSQNNAMGYGAMFNNTTGSNNSAFGRYALSDNTVGFGNTVIGAGALKTNTTGGNNTAAGIAALANNTTGSNNIAIGASAGTSLTIGSNNIDIGNTGAALDSGVIRIGTESPYSALQYSTYIAGIWRTDMGGGLAVVVDPYGQLGTVSSSKRFKAGIEPMGANTEKLQQLRPVTFHYKTDSQHRLRYGLIAEEVAKVYPELVVRDRDGRIDGVQYDELAPMLLNEMQKQQRINAALAEQNNAQAAKIALLEQQLTGIQSALLKLQPKDQLAAQR